jgi:hypothetical protein
MKALNSITYLAAITILGLALSCGGSNATTGEQNNVTIGNAEGIRTSSDMSISPPNMSAQDPMYRKNDTLTPAKDSIEPLIHN